MSEENTNKPRNEGGQRRQGSNNNRNRNRNRNRNNRNSNSNNRNSNDNRSKNQGRQRSQGRQGGGQGGRSPQRRRERQPLPLTTWQKILKFFGLYKDPTRPPRRTSETGPNTGDSSKPAAAKKAAKSNTRHASGKPQPSNTGKKARGDGSEKRNFPVETARLYLGNLSYEADESALEDLFKGVGTVRNVEIVYNRHTHRSKGFGFLEMQNVDEAKRAVEVLHDQPFMGRKLIVNGANSKSENTDNKRNQKPSRKPAQKAADQESSTAEASANEEQKVSEIAAPVETPATPSVAASEPAPETPATTDESAKTEV